MCDNVWLRGRAESTHPLLSLVLIVLSLPGCELVEGGELCTTKGPGRMPPIGLDVERVCIINPKFSVFSCGKILKCAFWLMNLFFVFVTSCNFLCVMSICIHIICMLASFLNGFCCLKGMLFWHHDTRTPLTVQSCTFEPFLAEKSVHLKAVCNKTHNWASGSGNPRGGSSPQICRSKTLDTCLKHTRELSGQKTFWTTEWWKQSLPKP